MAKYDLIVIGAGHNGLITAARLTKYGLKTLVLEKASILGGCSRTDHFQDFKKIVCMDHLWAAAKKLQ